MMKDNPELILERLGLRKTNLRKKLIQLFVNNQNPLPLLKIKKSVSSITTDRVTIYRELEKLQKYNLIESVDINGVNYYELTKKHHHHANCYRCKKIICLPCYEKNKPIDKSLFGWQKIKHQVLIKGLCNNCGNKYV